MIWHFIYFFQILYKELLVEVSLNQVLMITKMGLMIVMVQSMIVH